MSWRVVLGVAALWVVVGVIWGTQTALGGALRGEPVPLGGAVGPALIQSLPWIPVTLAVIALTVRFPLRRATLRRSLPAHLLALPLVAFAANVLVVLGFWTMGGRFEGVAELARQGAFWAVLRLHVAALLYAAIAAVTQAMVYWRDMRARELSLARLEGQLARARLDALTAQIRPHFLFNTLHTIGQLWRSGRSDEADAVLDDLGSLFHRVQRTTAQSEITLEEELEMVEAYLGIERVRFRDRLIATVRATPESLACAVPPLILQPLVENAIRHGISSTSKAGRVEVDAKVLGDRLVVTVTDDGPGMGNGNGDATRADGASGPAAGPAPGSGTGLRNTRERLEQAYGAAAALDVESVPGSGTTVRLTLPAGSRWAGAVLEHA